MRDIQLQSGKSMSERLSFDPPKKELFCGSCALDVAASLDNLRGVRVEIFPVVLLCSEGGMSDRGHNLLGLVIIGFMFSAPAWLLLFLCWWNK